MNLRIIQLEVMHLDDCIDLDQKSLKGLWKKSQWERELTDPNRICLGALEVVTGKILGICSAWLVLDQLHITLMAVHPLHLRKGLGKIILADLIKRSQSLQIKHIYLEVKESNEPAKALYKSMGFQIKGNRSNLYKDGSNALIFIKDLIDEPKTNNKVRLTET